MVIYLLCLYIVQVWPSRNMHAQFNTYLSRDCEAYQTFVILEASSTNISVNLSLFLLILDQYILNIIAVKTTGRRINERGISMSSTMLQDLEFTHPMVRFITDKRETNSKNTSCKFCIGASRDWRDHSFHWAISQETQRVYETDCERKGA